LNGRVTGWLLFLTIKKLKSTAAKTHGKPTQVGDDTTMQPPNSRREGVCPVGMGQAIWLVSDNGAKEKMTWCWMKARRTDRSSGK